MSVACIDASIAVKWILPEDDSEMANLLLGRAQRGGDVLVAPVHLHAQVTSAIYKRVRNGTLSPGLASQMLTVFDTLPLRRRHPPGLSTRALHVAIDLNMKYPYDAFYLALGELLDCVVWTADRALYAAAHESFPRLRLLSDYDAGQG